MKKKEAIEIIYPRVSTILTLRNHLICLKQMATLKEDDLRLSDCNLLNQIKYVIHNSYENNENFANYLKEKMPHDVEGYDLFVKPVTRGIDGSNLMYLACAIRYTLLEQQDAKVHLKEKEVLEAFKDIFLNIGENLNLCVRPYIIETESGVLFQQKIFE